LGKRTPVLDVGVERETMPLRHDMRNAAGGVMAAPLCIAAPEPYWLDDVVVPAPVLMSYEIVDAARDVREVEVLPRGHPHRSHDGFQPGPHRRRRQSRPRDRGVDRRGRQPRYQPTESFAAVDNPPIDVVDAPDMPRLHEVFGATRVDRGVWQLPAMGDGMSAPHGALHLGPINVALEAAAMDALGDDAAQVTSWTVTMQRPV